VPRAIPQSLLHARRILITRARHQASDLAAQLEALGAIPILIPTIEIVAPASYGPLDAALASLISAEESPDEPLKGSFDWLLFTSANAVEVFHHRMNLLEDREGKHSSGDLVSLPAGPNRAATNLAQLPGLAKMKIAVIGPATARAVESTGLAVALIPPRYVAESLAEALIPYAPGSRMLLVRAAEARDHLPEALLAAGAHLTIVEAYRNQTPPDSVAALQRIFGEPALYPDAITFTSASTATNLFALLEAAAITLPAKIVLASIGPITSRALRELGHEPTVESPTPAISSLIECLVQTLA